MPCWRLSRFHDVGPSGLTIVVTHLRGRGIKPIANGVASHNDHDRCVDAGFELWRALNVELWAREFL